MQMTRIALILLVAVFAGGCIGIDRPEVTVTAVRLDSVSEGSGRIAFDLLVDNPNAEELPMTTVSYSIDVVGAGRFEFTDIPYAAAPRDGQVALTLAGAVRGFDLAGKRVLIDGELMFEPQGELRRVFYDNSYPLPRSSFSGEGVLE